MDCNAILKMATAFEKLSQDLAQKGLGTSAGLQRYRTYISQVLNSLLGKVPNFTLTFNPNVEPVEYLGGEARKVGLKAVLNIQAEQDKVELLTSKLPPYLAYLFKPTEDAAMKGTAVFKYDLIINGSPISSDTSTS